MNKKSIIASITTLVLSAPLISLAAGVTSVNEPQVGGITSIDTVFNSITTIIWWAFVAISIIMFLIAGIMFLTAQGDSEKLQTARNSFFWGIAGVAVALIGYSVITIVRSRIPGA